MLPRTQALVVASQLGVSLRSTRKSLKLTLAQLGERLGLSQRGVSELERAPEPLSVDQLLALCAQLVLQLTIQPREQTQQPSDLPTAEW